MERNEERRRHHTGKNILKQNRRANRKEENGRVTGQKRNEENRTEQNRKGQKMDRSTLYIRTELTRT
jgi:hypothetical protein